MANTDYDADVRDYDDDRREYDRDRSRSPRVSGNDNGMRARSASPNGRERYDNSDAPGPENRDDPTLNPGSNLFVTGIAPRLSEEEVSRMFQEFGEVVNCNIMRDPHSGESRGFGFVKMSTAEAAEGAREGLTGKVVDNRTLSIEKARRGRPRTPTPGKYYGPPKRANEGPDFRSKRRFEPYEDRRGGGRFDQFDDRRRGYGGGRRDEHSSGYRGSGYRDRYEDRYPPGGDYAGGPGAGGRSYRDREDYPPRDRGDRYASGPPREDRYAGPPRGEDRRGGGYYPREDRAGGGPPRGYDDRTAAPFPDAPPREAREPYPAGGARGGYEDRGEDKYSRR